MSIFFGWANSMLFCVVAVLFFLHFLVVRSRVSKQMLYLTILLLSSAQFMIELMVNSYVRDYQQGLIMISHFSMALLIIQFLFIGSLYKKLLYAVLFSIFLSFTLETINLLQNLVLGKTVSSFSISMTIALLILLVFKKDKTDKAEIDSKLLTIEIIILSICSIASKIVAQEINYHSSPVAIKEILMLCISQIMLLLFYVTFEMILSTHKKNQDHKLQEQRHQLMKQHYKKIEDQQKEIIKMREEMDHQLSTIDEYISRGRIKEADRIIDSFIDQIGSSNSYNFTLNSGINALLNAKYSKAQSLGVVCEFDIKLYEQTTIKDVDLAIVIGNILDNAIEACDYCDTQKFIQFKLYQLNHSLAIFCENSTDGKVHSLRTRKNNTLKHGIGLKNVRETIDKYMGDMDITIHERSFVIEGTMLERGE